MRWKRSGGGCAGSSALFSTVPAVAPRLMGVDFSGRRLGRLATCPSRTCETPEITTQWAGDLGTRAKHKAHRSSRVLLPGLFNNGGIGWFVPRSYALWSVRPRFGVLLTHHF